MAINPGNSGGPLFNLDGEVVGVNSQIFSRSGGFMGLSFAVPIELAMNVVQQIREQGHVSRGYLGVLIQDVDRNLAQSFGLDHPRGALVARVIPDSPAAQSGLQVGDIVLSFNGSEIRYSSQLPPLVGATRVGDMVSMEILRNGKARTLQVKILELPREESEATVEKKAPAARPKGDRLGLVVAAPTAEERRALELPEGQGVIVRSVRKGAAATAGIEPGDAILLIDGQRVQGAEGYRRLVSALEVGRNVAVLVQKPGGPVFVALRVSQ